MEEIDNIRSILRGGIQLSGQMSYSRRAADEKAIPLLQDALSRLKAIVEGRQADDEVFRLLALAHENLLEYREAIEAVQECINRSAGPRKDDLKRLACYKEQLSWWETVSLSPRQLDELGVFLQSKLSSVPYEHSFKWTIAWLEEKKHRSPDKVISGLSAWAHTTTFRSCTTSLSGEDTTRRRWCCRTGLNCRPLPYQGSALPLSYGSTDAGKISAGKSRYRRRFLPQAPRWRKHGNRLGRLSSNPVPLFLPERPRFDRVEAAGEIRLPNTWQKMPGGFFR